MNGNLEKIVTEASVTTVLGFTCRATIFTEDGQTCVNLTLTLIFCCAVSVCCNESAELMLKKKAPCRLGHSRTVQGIYDL